MNSISFLTFLLSTLNAITAMTVDCDFKVHSIYGYGCEAKSIKSPKKQEIKYFCGNHQDGMEDSDVKYFMATNEGVVSFPEGIAEKFPNIETLSLNFPNLENVCNENVGPFGDKLKNLMILKSKVKFIHQNLFESTPNIVYLYLESDSIENIHKDAFKPLSNLRNFFTKFNSGKCSVNEDAINRNDAEKLVDQLAILCYDPKVKIPEHCKSTSIENIEEKDVECEDLEETSIWKEVLLVIGYIFLTLVLITALIFLGFRVFKIFEKFRSDTD